MITVSIFKTATTAPSVCPVRPTWGSFAQIEKADPDFMAEREDVVTDEG